MYGKRPTFPELMRWVRHAQRPPEATRVILSALLVLAAAVAPPDSASFTEALAAGDAHYARRAEGAHGGTALPFHADGAIVEYRRALSLNPRSYEARLRLMR